VNHQNGSVAKGQRVIRFWLILVGVAAAISPQLLVAQPANQADDAVRVGDQWTYDRKNEITGTLQDTYTAVVAEISPQEIVTNVTVHGEKASSLVSFDHNWNRLANGPWRYRPNDAHGFRMPLAVGQEWRSEYDQINVQTNVKIKATSVSKVLAQEMVTTPAGTFDTFKIERQVREFNVADPSRLTETQFVLWYASEINHWARRTILTRIEKRLRSNMSEQLVEFSRKQ
jgi:hypothetical protein